MAIEKMETQKTTDETRGIVSVALPLEAFYDRPNWYADMPVRVFKALEAACLEGRSVAMISYSDWEEMSRAHSTRLAAQYKL